MAFICELEPVKVDKVEFSEVYKRYLSEDHSDGKVFGYIPSPTNYSHLEINPHQVSYTVFCLNLMTLDLMHLTCQ